MTERQQLIERTGRQLAKAGFEYAVRNGTGKGFDALRTIDELLDGKELDYDIKRLYTAIRKHARQVINRMVK